MQRSICVRMSPMFCMQTEVGTHKRIQCKHAHTDKNRCCQTNTEWTASCVSADATSRRVQMLAACSRTFGMYYIKISVFTPLGVHIHYSSPWRHAVTNICSCTRALILFTNWSEVVVIMSWWWHMWTVKKLSMDIFSRKVACDESEIMIWCLWLTSIPLVFTIWILHRATKTENLAQEKC